jgi:hypothetical protein
VPRSVPRETWIDYAQRRLDGASRTAVCAELGLSWTAAAVFDRGEKRSTGYPIYQEMCEGREPFRTEQLRFAANNLPLGADRLSEMERHVLASTPVGPQNDAARAALADFHLFRPRYMGRTATPWQVMAAETVVQLLEDREEQYLCMNLAPGLGKSTLKHDICAWLTARDRAIRGLNGSRSEDLAKPYTAWLKRTLETQYPLPGAAAAMSDDFGVFKPPTREKWTDGAFIVYQADGRPIEGKDPTWNSYGQDTSQLGVRCDLIAWDDLVDPQKDLRPESMKKQRDFLDGTAQTRLEPRRGNKRGGLFWLIGQRVGADDLYHYALEKRKPPPDFAVLNQPSEEWPKQYVQISFPAHDEERCTKQHTEDAPPWPKGCLLDPVGLPWSKLAGIEHNNERLYHVQYQQKDLDPDSVLCNPSWLNYDDDRSSWQGLTPAIVDDKPVHRKTISFITIDPSGTQYWGQQAWLYEPAGDEGLGGQRYLMDLRDTKQEVSALFGWSFERGEFYGLLEEWRRNFKDVGRPLKFVVVEINAFARWLVQEPHIQRWARQHGITLIKHATGVTKSDPKMGVWATQAHWRFKRIVLPGASLVDRRMSKPLTDQVTRWPGSYREDEVMAYWFGERNLKQMVLATPAEGERKREWRPSWMLEAGERRGLFNRGAA